MPHTFQHSDEHCTVVLPYHATIYHDGYVPQGQKPEVYMTDSGTVPIPLTPAQLAALKAGSASSQYAAIRLLIKQLATDILNHDMTISIEHHEGIGGFNAWALPLTTRIFVEFASLRDIQTMLKGTQADWQQRKGGIYLKAKMQLCVTADL